MSIIESPNTCKHRQSKPLDFEQVLQNLIKGAPVPNNANVNKINGSYKIYGIMKKIIRFSGYLISVFIFICGAFAEETPKDDFPKYSSPKVDQSYPTNVYWGDTHLHTNLSADAYSLGNRKLGVEEAYRFAKGKSVKAHNGMKALLDRPLDFLVIADHAIQMGVLNGIEAGDPGLLRSSEAKALRFEFENIQKGEGNTVDNFFSRFTSRMWRQKVKVGDDQFNHSVWESVTALADKHNEPGKFTAFIGYEWTATFNLHRVVIFRDDASKANKIIPFSVLDSRNPEDLWNFLENYSVQTGGEVLAITHNANLSIGVMFAVQDATGRPMSEHYARMRSRWEPLYEVTQNKGDSETHPILSPDDEFADFETWSIDYSEEIVERQRQWDVDNYKSWLEEGNHDLSNPNWQRPYEYARSGLKLGLQQQAKLGVNPFKFGMIGSTDAHSSLAGADEMNFWGTTRERSADRLLVPLAGAATDGPRGWKRSAAGYAAVWAEENTRESLFTSMKRKEVYATTGPRMTVRFFGGWDYHTDDAFKPDLAKIGYAKGVPMGGDLTNAPKGKSPSFLIRAVRDPDGANLDRVQVIKGWHDKHGELHEKIYNVALSDGRKGGKNGKAKPVGSTVDVKDASYTNRIGDPELAVVWQDPDFDKDELAFYYVRVLEIPTPRWTAYDAKYFGLTDIPDKVPMVIQERAYTSPIWFIPTTN